MNNILYSSRTIYTTPYLAPHTNSSRLSPLSHYIFFFSFQCYAHHRALHSFPTRRSSDLTGRNGRPFGLTKFRTMHPCDEPRSEWVSDNVDRITRVGRSEEHTSELQSPYDLVCRLLLEKKKKTQQT